VKIYLTLALLLCSACAAQAADAPRFEAATLKQAPPPTTESYPITLGLVNGTRLNLTNVTLADCLKYAWGLVSDEQITGPQWIWSREDLYDIVAVVPPDAPREQIMLMTQTLLRERLGLVIYHEPKELKYLALVPGKSGPKLQPADRSEERNNSGGRGHLTGNRVSMALVASLLSRLEHQIVVDRTGIEGEYRIALKWAPGSGTTDAATDDSAGPSLFAAVQEQLGLRLEARKGPLDSIVIDHVEKIPAEN
jgi:uncharacterized protein (TIGR03435 family)